MMTCVLVYSFYTNAAHKSHDSYQNFASILLNKIFFLFCPIVNYNHSSFFFVWKSCREYGSHSALMGLCTNVPNVDERRSMSSRSFFASLFLTVVTIRIRLFFLFALLLISTVRYLRDNLLFAILLNVSAWWQTSRNNSQTSKRTRFGICRKNDSHWRKKKHFRKKSRLLSQESDGMPVHTRTIDTILFLNSIIWCSLTLNIFNPI